jgi:NRAMP (natural resistance-associated macrophage protein)-like metal ion transporter
MGLKRVWKSLGPGLVTGSSDDDPSGIATYSQAGAGFGLNLLWTAIFTYPMMVAIQEMCARLGLVTGRGLAANIKQHYSRPVLWLILTVSTPAILLNIGANIAGMGAVGNLVFPNIPSTVFSVAFTGILLVSVIRLSYRRIASVLKWLCISLLSYILIPFLIGTNWGYVLERAVLPQITWSTDFLIMLVAILGTTISPYLFFWQTSMEVEEQMEHHLVVDKTIMSNMQGDVRGGMFYTTLVFFFIILTTATVLHPAGITNITTVEEAARSLQPLAGDMAYALFALGVIGTGLIAIPVLAGALSYMYSETFAWAEGLDRKFHEAPGFYLVMAASLLVGLLIDVVDVSPIQALIATAVLYGLTAPVLIGIVIHLCNRKDVMGEYANSKTSNILGLVTWGVMTACAVMLIIAYLE